MFRVQRKPSFVLVVAVVMLVLLPLLAYLQYDWLGKVSEREREQMQSGLSRTLIQFRQDFDREIARIYLHFQTQPDTVVRLGEEYSKLFGHWNATAPYPRLIRDIFFDQTESDGQQTLRHLNMESGTWEAADWTTQFGPRRLFRDSEELGPPGFAGRFMQYPLGPVDGSIPAVVVPLLGPFTALRLDSAEAVTIPQPFGQIIVRLNLDYMRNDFLPALVRTHFAQSASEYKVRVTDSEDDLRMIYDSEPQSDSGSRVDAAEDILSLRLPEFYNVVSPPPAHQGDVIGGWASTQTFSMRFVRSAPIAALPGVMVQTNAGAWKVTATHQSGSLDAAVGQVRRRNLAMSFSILILLALSVGIVLVSSQRAQRLARQQMEFVSAVSHELRTPLAVICSAGENLADGVVRDVDQLKSYGKVVRNEGRRLAEMVEQVLSFAGIQSGRKKYSLGPVKVADVVDRSLYMLELSLREGGFSVERQIAGDLPAVLADAQSLTRVMQNLISNAIKYSGTSRWIGVSAFAEGRVVKIRVQDRGIGISSSDLPHIFEPFYRGRQAVEGQIQGNGLGLSLVKQIVDASGAQIDVTPNPGGGCTFCVTLPIAYYSSKTNPGS